MLLGSTTDDKLLQPSNVPSLSDDSNEVTLFGIIIDVKLLHP